MRLFLISLAALSLLAAGCAGSRPGNPEVAPSRQASLSDSNSGWSVPPGQKHVTDPQPEAAPQTAQEQPDEAAIAEAQRRDREAAAQAARERLERERAAGERQTERQAERQPIVQPLVPAFPARAADERVLSLRTVHFAFDQWDLTAEARALLDMNARWLKANPETVVRIAGHADERGTPEYNLALGERRANRVRDYLILQGVPGDNLTTISYGEEMPVDPGHSSEAWSLNRRAEFSKAEARQVSDAGGRPTSG